MRRELICVAKGRAGAWEAICLDLDIAVAGPSFESVRTGLNQAITSYIEDALAEPEPVRSKLLNRRVPLFARIRWTLPFLLATLFRRRNAEETSEFSVLCPA